MRRSLLVVTVSVLLLFGLDPPKSARGDKAQLVDLEQKVGKGWQCFAIPSGLEKVGVIFEQRPDKSVFYVDDLKETSALSAPVAIGSMSTSKQFSIGAAIKLISIFFPSLNISYERDKKTTVVISGAEEVVGGGKVSEDAVGWAQKNLNEFHPDSRLFVIREAIVASGVTYTFDTTTATAISAQLSLTQPKTGTTSAPSNGNSTNTGNPPSKSATPPADNPSSSQSSTISQPKSPNQIAQSFDPKIGLCIHPDEIILGNSYGGELKVILKPVTDDLAIR